MTKEERAEKWDSEFIPCIRHPDRRCNRYYFIRREKGRCGSCNTNYRLDGTYRPAKLRNRNSEQSYWNKKSRRRHLKIMENKI